MLGPRVEQAERYPGSGKPSTGGNISRPAECQVRQDGVGVDLHREHFEYGNMGDADENCCTYAVLLLRVRWTLGPLGPLATWQRVLPVSSFALGVASFRRGCS